MVLLCRNNATINIHVKTQNRVKHWHTDPTRPSQNRWPVTHRPGSISDSTACCIHPAKSSSIFPAHAQNSKDTSFPLYLCHCLVLSVRRFNILYFGFNVPHRPTRNKTQFCDSYLFSLWWTHLLNQKLMIWGLYRVWLKGWHVNPTAGRQLGYSSSYFTRTPPVQVHRPVQPVAPSLPLRSACRAKTMPSQPRISHPLPSSNFLWN